jgi:hypothetical protein
MHLPSSLAESRKTTPRNSKVPGKILEIRTNTFFGAYLYAMRLRREIRTELFHIDWVTTGLVAV